MPRRHLGVQVWSPEKRSGWNHCAKCPHVLTLIWYLLFFNYLTPNGSFFILTTIMWNRWSEHEPVLWYKAILPGNEKECYIQHMSHINLICITASERDQSQRLHTVSCHLWLPGKGKTGDEEQTSGCQGLGLGVGSDNKGASWGNCFEGRLIVLYPDCGGGYRALGICKNSQNCTSKKWILMCACFQGSIKRIWSKGVCFRKITLAPA